MHLYMQSIIALVAMPECIPNTNIMHMIKLQSALSLASHGQSAFSALSHCWEFGEPSQGLGTTYFFFWVLPNSHTEFERIKSRLDSETIALALNISAFIIMHGESLCIEIFNQHRTKIF